MSTAYNLGDQVRCTGTITKKEDGSAVDPTDVYGWFRAPGGNVTTYHYGVDSQMVRSAQGVYHMDVNVDAKGTYYYGFYSTGVAHAAGPDGSFSVVTSKRLP